MFCAKCGAEQQADAHPRRTTHTPAGPSRRPTCRPAVQGQENLSVHSKTVASHTTKDASTIVFKVDVEWSPDEDPGTVKTSTESYTLKKTDKGWRIVSTPAYP